VGRQDDLQPKQDVACGVCGGDLSVGGSNSRHPRTVLSHEALQDVRFPTKAEVDEWHRLAINHVRALVGYTSADRQASPDICMFARALWGDQRKFNASAWDARYPGVLDSAAGPCVGGKNAHCGASFLPDAADQAPYLPAGHAPCVLTQGAEGVFSGPKSNIAWSLKWSRALCITLLAEGFWGGHTGPFFHREKFGLSFWDPNPAVNNNNAILRAKWTGRLMPNLYCDPSATGCDPEKTGPGSGNGSAIANEDSGEMEETVTRSTAATVVAESAKSAAGKMSMFGWVLLLVKCLS
jgi:hypothetical protein